MPLPTTDSTKATQLTFSELQHWSGSNFRFDFTQIYGKEGRKKMKNYITHACKLAGFKVEAHVKLTQPNEARPNASKSCAIHFKCALNKKAFSELPKQQNAPKRVRTQYRPIHIKDKCPFQFHVHCNIADSCWYLTLKQDMKTYHEARSYHQS